MFVFFISDCNFQTIFLFNQITLSLIYFGAAAGFLQARKLVCGLAGIARRAQGGGHRSNLRINLCPLSFDVDSSCVAKNILNIYHLII